VEQYRLQIKIIDVLPLLQNIRGGDVPVLHGGIVFYKIFLHEKTLLFSAFYYYLTKIWKKQGPTHLPAQHLTSKKEQPPVGGCSFFWLEGYQ